MTVEGVDNIQWVTISGEVHMITPEEDHPISLGKNIILDLVGSEKRARVILSGEDVVKARGIWTKDQAREVASRLNT